MFLHLGHDVVVPLKEIICIIGLDETNSPINREFLRTAEDEGFVIQLDENPISCIITTENIVLSSISRQTLKKRAKKVHELMI